MLTADEVKPLQLHEDLFVRRAATRYFADGRSCDPEILPRVLDACDRFGWESMALRGASFLKLTGPALDRILAALGGTGDEMLRRSLNWIIREVPGDLAAARREAILAAPGLESQVVRTIEARAEVDSLEPAAIWEELQDHCRRADAGGGDDFDDIRVEALVEALGRRDVPDEATIVGLLDDPNAWLAGEMVVLAGLRRIAAAVPALVNKIGEDSDFLFEEVQYALARINDPEAVRLILAAYPAATEDYRQTACWALENLRVPEAEDALLRLLETEADATLRTILCEGLCQMFSRRGVEAVARQIAAGYDTSLLTLEEDLLPVVDVLGVDLPGVDLDAWRAARDLGERQQEEIIAGMFRSEARAARLEARGLDPWDRSFPEPGPVPAAATPGLVAPIRREAARVGRNDPCPCGSGKKFKKCCGKNA